MPLATTTIGPYPKPDYIDVTDWFKAPSGPDTAEPTCGWAKAVEAMGDEAEAIFARGVKEVIEGPGRRRNRRPDRRRVAS